MKPSQHLSATVQAASSAWTAQQPRGMAAIGRPVRRRLCRLLLIARPHSGLHAHHGEGGSAQVHALLCAAA
jgi:hypothetical protein